MNRKSCFLSVFALCLTFAVGVSPDAQAKRLGGGSSFGGKPSYSQPFKGEPMANSFPQPIRSPSQQQAAMQNQAARQGNVNRSGLLGVLGGLALGGLLGSMLFGGAFEHLNFMDFLAVAVILYIVYRLFAAMSAWRSGTFADVRANDSHKRIGGNVYTGNRQGFSSISGFNTDLLFEKNKNVAGKNFPAGFDKQAFLAGAKRAYLQLQSAWDKRDLTVIRGLTTDKVFEVIQEQLRSASFDTKTEVLNLQAELIDVRESFSELEAAVSFLALMREDGGPEQQIREVWRFIRPINSSLPKWFLDGVQQFQE